MEIREFIKRAKEIRRRESAWREAQQKYAKVLEKPVAERSENELAEAAALLHEKCAEYCEALDAS